MSALLAVASNVYPNGLGSPGGPVGSGSGSATYTSVTSSGSNLFGFLGGLIAVVVIVALLGVFVVIVVANRAEPDPTGRRPRAVYHFFVAFVTVLTAVAGSVLAIWSLLRLIGTHGAPLGDEIARALVLGGLITLASLMLLTRHLHRGLELAKAGADPSDPSRRVGQSYVSAVSFIFVLVEVATAVFSVYLIFVLIAPGVFGSFGGRTDALRDLLDAVYLSLLAAIILRSHRDMLQPGLGSTV